MSCCRAAPAGLRGVRRGGADEEFRLEEIERQRIALAEDRLDGLERFIEPGRGRPRMPASERDSRTASITDADEASCLPCAGSAPRG
jgi:hypothetical protein